MRAAIAVVPFVIALAGCSAPDESSPSQAPSSSPTASPMTTTTAAPSATPAPTATPTPAATPQTAGTYLALGDSLAVGVGATRPAQTGYVGRLFSILSASEAADDGAPRAAALLNLSVSGETSTSMIRQGQLAGALDAIATADPVVALVTLDIGGNDLLRLLGTDACANDPLGADCLGLLALTLDDYEANFRQIVGELIAALNEHAPDARLVVLTYFNPFSGTDASYEAAAELALLGNDNRIDCDATDREARGMNDIIVCVGQELGALPVNVQPGFQGLGLELTHIGQQDIHANDRGYELMANEVATALRR